MPTNAHLGNQVKSHTCCMYNFCKCISIIVCFHSIFGSFLMQPPVGIERASEIGRWEEREVKVSGLSWDVNSIDISVAGLGWLSLGLKGEATLTLWTFDGIDITMREPLVLDRAPSLERPGFWLPKAVSDAIGNQTKLEAQRKKLEEENAESLLEVSS